MKKIFLFLVFYLTVCLCSAQDIKVYFSPNGGCQQAVISEIRKAAQTIDIAMYYLSSRDIAQALIRASENNVRVRVVLDQGQEIESASKSGYLVRHGLEVRYHLGFGLMHNKFAIIDGKSLITGNCSRIPQTTLGCEKQSLASRVGIKFSARPSRIKNALKPYRLIPTKR